MLDLPKQLKTDLKRKKIKGLALDIDETLSWTISYWVKHLQAKFGNPQNLSTTQILEKYRFTQNVPFWQTKEALDWMEYARKSNEIQEILPLVENANKIVQKINQIIPVVCYLTIRSQSVIPGTQNWLNKHSFPQAPVIAKPDNISYDKGSIWKAETLTNLYPQVLGIIDDNPSIVDYLKDEYKGIVFLYNNLEIPKTKIKVIPCKTWDDVLEKVQGVS